MKTPILDEFIEELQELKDGNFSLTKDLEERLIEFKNIKSAINYTHSCMGKAEQVVCDKCNEDGWITENKGDILEHKLCNHVAGSSMVVLAENTTIKDCGLFTDKTVAVQKQGQTIILEPEDLRKLEKTLGCNFTI